jgi:hypothetical protein
MTNLEKDERAWLERAENGCEMFAQAVKEKEESDMIDFTNNASGEIRCHTGKVLPLKMKSTSFAIRSFKPCSTSSTNKKLHNKI